MVLLQAYRGADLQRSSALHPSADCQDLQSLVRSCRSHLRGTAAPGPRVSPPGHLPPPDSGAALRNVRLAGVHVHACGGAAKEGHAGSGTLAAGGADAGNACMVAASGGRRGNESAGGDCGQAGQRPTVEGGVVGVEGSGCAEAMEQTCRGLAADMCCVVMQ